MQNPNEAENIRHKPRLLSGLARARRSTLALLTAGLISSCALSGHSVKAPHRPLLAALDHGLRPSLLESREPLPGWSLQQRMAHYHVPGVAIAVLRNGEVVHAAGYGVRVAGTRDLVDADTLFSVGSISKVVTAAASLRLTAQDRMSLDRDVNAYLSSWRIPPSTKFADATVTMRMLLSHTSGLNVHGFADYLPGESLPTAIETLNGIAPAKNGPVHLVNQPGLRNDYSGGGFMVAQRVIEELSGAPFGAVAHAEVFAPLGMRRSSFTNPLPADRGNIAKAHDGEGALTALPRGWQSFPELAASGLWTSANELGAFTGALIRSYQGKDSFLPQALARQMMTEVSPSWHGLGPRLDGSGVTRIFHHGGSNDSYQAWLEGYLDSGDGFVILTNGENGKPLIAEIRNALSDAFGHGVNPPIRAMPQEPNTSSYADYAGAYRLDSAMPMDLRRELADLFDLETFDVTVAGGVVAVSRPGKKEALSLLPLTPNRFVLEHGMLQFEFHRDAYGHVSALSLEHGAARAYYRRALPQG